MIRKIGKAVLWAGVILAALMVASGSDPNVHHKTSQAGTLGAALFVAAAGALVGGVLMVLGRRTK